VLYVRAGILESSDTSEVRDAIITDTAITERQKQVLLDIYTSFCQQNEAVSEEPTTEPTADQLTTLEIQQYNETQ
jgi:hypothetical protein